MSITRDDVINWLNAYGQKLAENKEYLTQLDSDIGDADHGANMDRGFKAALAKLPTVADKDIGTLFKSVGMTLVQTVGGAGGPLYGTFFMQAGTASANKMELSAAIGRRLSRLRSTVSSRAVKPALATRPWSML